MVKANFHTHSVFCDGHDTPQNIAAYAFRNGFTHLGFSGHMDPDIQMDMPAYYQCIRSLQEQYRGKMDILRGVEVDTLSDTSCLYDAEYWIGSTHLLDIDAEKPLSVDWSPEQLLLLLNQFYGSDPYALAKAYYRLVASLYDRTGCTFIGHFDLVVRFNDQLHFIDEDDPRYLGCALEAMEYLVREGIPFEVNCGAVNRGRKRELYPNMRLLKALHDLGGEIFINSDAHQKELLSGAFGTAATAARACGFTHTNILEHDANDHVVIRQVPLDLFDTGTTV